MTAHPLAPLERGGLGEVPLHAAILYNTDQHFEIAKYLIERSPQCLTAVYLDPLYRGETALHIAIVNKRLDWIKYERRFVLFCPSPPHWILGT